MILGEELTVHGNGMAARDFVFVDDVCRALDLIIQAPADRVVGEVINLATAQDRRILDVAQDVVRTMRKLPKKIILQSDRPGQVIRHTRDNAKAARLPGWKPQVSWEDGLTQTIEWYCKNRPWWEKQIWMRHIPITTAAGKLEFH